MPDKGLLGAAGSQPHAMSSRRRTGSSRGQRAWHDVRDACSLGLRQPFPAAQKRQAGSCCPRTRARARARAARRRRGPRSTKGRGAFLQGRRAGAPACAANRRRQRGSPVIACVLTQASIEPGRPHISSRTAARSSSRSARARGRRHRPTFRSAWRRARRPDRPVGRRRAPSTALWRTRRRWLRATAAARDTSRGACATRPRWSSPQIMPAASK